MFRMKAGLGFGFGTTISHDNVTLRSQRDRLVGRPDRILVRGESLIIEDKKSARRLHDSHRAQMGVYMLLAEEHYGIRPLHAVVVLGDGSRKKVKNTMALRSQVLEVARQIREARKDVSTELSANASKPKCRSCSQRANCNQRL